MTKPSFLFLHERPGARRLLAGLVILTTFGCQSTPASPVPQAASTKVTSSKRDATALLDAARTAEPHAAAVMYVDAARDLVQRGELVRAEEVLAMVDTSLLKPRALVRYQIARATIATESGRADDAYRILSALETTESGDERDRAAALELAATASGRYAEAAELAMASADGDSQERNDRIWSYLVQSPPITIEMRATSTQDSTVRAWWQLANAVERAFDTTEQRAALASWQREYSGHPAAVTPPTALRRLTSDARGAAHVALLLPLSGQLASAGRAVRDGFVAAFYRAGSTREITVYDTAAESIAALYEQAILDGSDVIVGPLDKTNVSQLNALPVRLAPALVLNRLGDGETPGQGLYQFSLAIEDEGQAIADRVADDRRERIVLLRADQDWASRATTAFFAKWPDARNAIVSEGVIQDVRSLTDTVARALSIDQSNQRAKALMQLLGERVEYVPRRRQDVDAVVAFVDALQARALVPALAYYFAADVPVYTSSQAVQGLDRAALSELEGTRVCQIPWKVGADPLRDEIETAFVDARGVLGSLYAFGVDAYRIVDRLDTLLGDSPMRLLGATGVLTLGTNGEIGREPSWAIVRGGRLDALPILIDTLAP